MTNKKVKLSYISNVSARKATFKKRKKGLMKKVSELSTLCGIEACMIVYGSYDPQPEVWPSLSGAHQILSRFKNLSELEQNNKMVNQESFLRQRIMKVNQQVQKQCKDNREKEMTNIISRCLGGQDERLRDMSIVDLNDLGWFIDQKLKEMYSKIQSISDENHKQHQPRPQAPPQSIPITPVFVSNHFENLNKNDPGWCLDLMNSQEQTRLLEDDIMMHFIWDSYNNPLWSI